MNLFTLFLSLIITLFITSPTGIYAMKPKSGLKELNISGRLFSDETFQSMIGQFPNLEKLSLEGSSNLSTEALMAITQLSQLAD